MCYPVAIFCYKRFDTLQLTVETLSKNYLARQTDLYIFSDGAKHESDTDCIKKVRSYLKTITGFKSISIVEAETNKGLAKSIISGTTEVLTNNEAVIVMEDDLLTTPNFLTYMNSALEKYRDEKKVFSISGYSFNLTKNTDVSSIKVDAYLINRGWSWGWATWKDRWENIDWEVSDYNVFKTNSKERKAFSKGGSDLNSMLEKQMNGKLDSWAVRWFYHQYKVGGLTLYPVLSKVYNNGFDTFSTHTKGSANRYIPLLDTYGNTTFTFPDTPTINTFFQARFNRKMNVYSRIKSRITDIFFKANRRYGII